MTCSSWVGKWTERRELRVEAVGVGGSLALSADEEKGSSREEGVERLEGRPSVFVFVGNWKVELISSPVRTCNEPLVFVFVFEEEEERRDLSELLTSSPDFLRM